MKKQYKIQLPKGKAVVTVKTNVDNDNGVMTMDVDFCDTFIMPPIPPKYEPKEGDFIFVKSRLRPYVTKYSFIGIFCNIIKDEGCTPILLMYASLKDDNRLVYGNSIEPYNNSEYIRPATESEKKLLIEKLAEVGKRWNEEDKTIEDMRWRAEKNKEYYYVTPTYYDVDQTFDRYTSIDDGYYNTGNYFKTREAAEKAAEQIREIFKNSKAE